MALPEHENDVFSVKMYEVVPSKKVSFEKMCECIYSKNAGI